MEKYSVLMLVYYREDAEFLREAALSMLRQTVAPDDFVIVCDGPLTEALDAVLAQLQEQYPDVMHIHRLAKNVGIGRAANEGIGLCRNELIAKMDADDIALADRCEIQLKEFKKNPDLAILGGNIAEFSTDSDHPHALRVVPSEYRELCRFARRRQPFNNVTVMLRKSAVLSVGGYRGLRRGEDYDLYARLLHAGFYGENLPVVLVNVRMNPEAMVRRTSVSTFKGCVQSRWNAYQIGFISLGDFLYCSLGALFLLIAPARLNQYIYSKLFRSRHQKEKSEHK